MKKSRYILLISVFLFVFLFNTNIKVNGQIPKIPTVQMLLTDPAGNPVADGEYTVTVSLYDFEAALIPVWHEAQQAVAENGLVNLVLGEVVPLNLAFNRPYYVGIKIDNGDEMQPRLLLHPSVMSISARAVYGDSNIFPDDGDVGIGTLAPQAKLDVEGQVRIADVPVIDTMSYILVNDTLDDKIVKAMRVDTFLSVMNKLAWHFWWWGWPGLNGKDGKDGKDGAPGGFGIPGQDIIVKDSAGNIVMWVDAETGDSWHSGLEQYEKGIIVGHKDSSYTWIKPNGEIGMYKKNGDPITVFSPDGTSWHSGLEYYKEGVLVGDSSKVYISPEGEILIYADDSTLVSGFYPDGTSWHSGKEYFEGGIVIGNTDSTHVRIDEDGTIRIVKPSWMPLLYDVITKFNPDGTSEHTGLETYRGGISVPWERDSWPFNVTGQIKLTPEGSIVILDSSGDTITAFNSDGTSFHSGKETFNKGISVPQEPYLGDSGEINIDPEKGFVITDWMGDTVTVFGYDGTSFHQRPELFAGGISVTGVGEIIMDPLNGLIITDFLGDTVTTIDYNGNSYHNGLETFAGGIFIPGGNDGSGVKIDTTGRILVLGPGGVIDCEIKCDSLGGSGVTDPNNTFDEIILPFDGGQTILSGNKLGRLLDGNSSMQDVFIFELVPDFLQFEVPTVVNNTFTVPNAEGTGSVIAVDPILKEVVFNTSGEDGYISVDEDGIAMRGVAGGGEDPILWSLDFDEFMQMNSSGETLTRLGDGGLQCQFLEIPRYVGGTLFSIDRETDQIQVNTINDAPIPASIQINPVAPGDALRGESLQTTIFGQNFDLIDETGETLLNIDPQGNLSSYATVHLLERSGTLGCSSSFSSSQWLMFNQSQEPAISIDCNGSLGARDVTVSDGEKTTTIDPGAFEVKIGPLSVVDINPGDGSRGEDIQINITGANFDHNNTETGQLQVNLDPLGNFSSFGGMAGWYPPQGEGGSIEIDNLRVVGRDEIQVNVSIGSDGAISARNINVTDDAIEQSGPGDAETVLNPGSAQFKGQNGQTDITDGSLYFQFLQDGSEAFIDAGQMQWNNGDGSSAFRWDVGAGEWIIGAPHTVHVTITDDAIEQTGPGGAETVLNPGSAQFTSENGYTEIVGTSLYFGPLGEDPFVSLSGNQEAVFGNGLVVPSANNDGSGVRITTDGRVVLLGPGGEEICVLDCDSTGNGGGTSTGNTFRDGIFVVNAQGDTLTAFYPNGFSRHKGVEQFDEGLIVGDLENTGILLSPDGRFTFKGIYGSMVMDTTGAVGLKDSLGNLTTLFKANGESYHGGPEYFYDGIFVIDSEGDTVTAFYNDGGSRHKGIENFEEKLYVRANQSPYGLELNPAGSFSLLHNKGVFRMDSNGLAVMDSTWNITTLFKPNGESLHTGLETYKGGIFVPSGDDGSGVKIDTLGRVVLLGPGGEEICVLNCDSTSGGGNVFTDGLYVVNEQGDTVTAFYPDGLSVHEEVEFFQNGISIGSDGLTGGAVVRHDGSFVFRGTEGSFEMDSQGNISIKDTLGNIMTQFKNNGESLHIGLETYKGGIFVPQGDDGSGVKIDTLGRVVLLGPGGEEICVLNCDSTGGGGNVFSDGLYIVNQVGDTVTALYNNGSYHKYPEIYEGGITIGDMASSFTMISPDGSIEIFDEGSSLASSAFYPDGTSIHRGLEYFDGGLRIQLADGTYAVFDPDPEIGFAIFDAQGNFLHHMHPGGNAWHQGVLAAGIKAFRIDHPLDPENKFLQHSSVESNEMTNMYNGNIFLDENGEAEITMPDWFDALNENFRYQLTPIGAPGPNLYIAEKMNNNKFKIAGGEEGMEVSWQVTGTRKDTYALENPLKVEVDKSETLDKMPPLKSMEIPQD